MTNTKHLEKIVDVLKLKCQAFSYCYLKVRWIYSKNNDLCYRTYVYSFTKSMLDA